MKEHKMRKSFLLSTLERYKAAGYPRESINCLQDLESRCERLEDLLEEFRHIQPGKRLFSSESIGVIKEFHELREQIYRLEDELDELRSRLPKSEEMITFLPTDKL
jgi:uncharacterized protein YhaN